ncbi:MAG: transposase, partial [Succinatimonas sp.]|nr:transposase [Succinatimonas sp.]
YLIRKIKYPTIANKLWGDAILTPSYFAASCGGAPISIIKLYIENQNTPE